MQLCTFKKYFGNISRLFKIRFFFENLYKFARSIFPSHGLKIFFLNFECCVVNSASFDSDKPRSIAQQITYHQLKAFRKFLYCISSHRCKKLIVGAGFPILKITIVIYTLKNHSFISSIHTCSVLKTLHKTTPYAIIHFSRINVFFPQKQKYSASIFYQNF